LEKDTLFKAGLGPKKIQFNTEDSEDEVLDKISSDCIKDNETIGFPKLKKCGRFELLKCHQNCRELTLIDCEWSV